MAVTVPVRMLVDRAASGELLLLSEGLSFWGGLDPASGEIIDRQHPQHGAKVTGKVLVLPSPRGSTAAPGALLECLCEHSGPAAIVLATCDPTAIAAVLAAQMIEHPAIPVAQLLDPADLQVLTGIAYANVGQGLLTEIQPGWSSLS
ncbi:DUF126 domain-containing protein [Pseudohalioglobus sediminis]|uniref:DUF126 domain-containing protein n=1 Tax=Pseudohalioglobus sediminis TaxID=2606449 RepID=A0A5B0WR50_9GAMM|nr:DUF126 domain-containing protein [Pseudohalioglobus sediminis]KAA1188399.1 DUF126 domain-containing protein [Pseudohalioglobus sediminis]